MDKNPKYTLLVVGSGGTGTYFLKEISRYLCKKDISMLKKMIIIDGDIIERKNLSRQAFIEDDIGRNKADVMSEALNAAFKLRWTAYCDYIFEVEQISQLVENGTIPVIIGCVDNHGCRLLMEDYFYSVSNCIYYDAANEMSQGECTFSAVINDVIASPCRSYFFPDMLDGDVRGRDAISCEELNNSAPQHILANMTSGLQLLSAFIQLLESETIQTGYSVYDPFRFMNKSYSAEQCKWRPLKREEALKICQKK